MGSSRRQRILNGPSVSREGSVPGTRPGPSLSSVSDPSPTAPLPGALTSAVSSSLAALESTLPPEIFWSPAALGLAPDEDQKAYILAAGGSPWGFELRALPAWSRITALYDAMTRGQGPRMPKLERGRRATAYAAGLQLELVFGLRGEILRCGDERFTWLPEGLEVPGNLDLRGSAIAEIPKGLKVGAHLDLPLVQGLTTLPEGLVVGRDLHCESTWVASLPRDLQARFVFVARSPLALLSDGELDEMCPGISRRVVR